MVRSLLSKEFPYSVPLSSGTREESGTAVEDPQDGAAEPWRYKGFNGTGLTAAARVVVFARMYHLYPCQRAEVTVITFPLSLSTYSPLNINGD